MTAVISGSSEPEASSAESEGQLINLAAELAPSLRTSGVRRPEKGPLTHLAPSVYNESAKACVFIWVMKPSTGRLRTFAKLDAHREIRAAKTHKRIKRVCSVGLCMCFFFSFRKRKRHFVGHRMIHLLVTFLQLVLLEFMAV